MGTCVEVIERLRVQTELYSSHGAGADGHLDITGADKGRTARPVMSAKSNKRSI